jgi:hypothetical protein
VEASRRWFAVRVLDVSPAWVSGAARAERRALPTLVASDTILHVICDSGDWCRHRQGGADYEPGGWKAWEHRLRAWFSARARKTAPGRVRSPGIDSATGRTPQPRRATPGAGWRDMFAFCQVGIMSHLRCFASNHHVLHICRAHGAREWSPGTGFRIRAGVGTDKEALITSQAVGKGLGAPLAPWFSARARKTAPGAGALPGIVRPQAERYNKAYRGRGRSSILTSLKRERGRVLSQ